METDSSEFEQARKSLLDAVALLRRSGAGSNAAGGAHLYQPRHGVHRAQGQRARPAAVDQSLQINPKAKLDPLATPELQPLWDAAVAQASGPPRLPCPRARHTDAKSGPAVEPRDRSAGAVANADPSDRDSDGDPDPTAA